MQYTVEELQTMPENQTFDRKSIRIDPKNLADPIIAFANADGGTIAIGIDDKTREIEGIRGFEEKINEFLRVPFDFCRPTIKVDFKRIDCIDKEGNTNQILLLDVYQSFQVHTNQADAVFYRIGDKSKKLSFDERMQLIYDKGDMLYEDTYVREASLEDIDMNAVEEYINIIGYSKTPLEYLSEGKGFIRKGNDKYDISAATVLLLENSHKTSSHEQESALLNIKV